MELWFIYAIIGTFLLGMISFSSKISVEKKHNPFLITFYITATSTLFGIVFFFMFSRVSYNLGLEIFLGLINGGFYLVTVITRIKSLQYIDTSIYFPIYKAISPILLLVVTIFFFNETFKF